MMKLNKHKTLLRFIINYTLILILPLIIFSSVYNNYFLKMYEDTTLNQHQDILNRTNEKLSEQVENMQSISNQLYFYNDFYPAQIRNKFTSYINIKNTLASITQTQSFIDSIMYFNINAPDYIYTNVGTYNRVYYFSYDNYGTIQDAPNFLININNPMWISKSQMILTDSVEKNYAMQYIVPNKTIEGGYSIFSISKQKTENLLNGIDGELYFVDTKDNVIFSNQENNNSLNLDTIRNTYSQEYDGPIEYNNDKFIIISKNMSSNIQIIQLVDKNILFSKVIKMQTIFNYALIALAIIGGFLVYIMVFTSYKPIKKMYSVAQTQVSDIPDNMSILEKTTFALEKIGQQNREYEQRGVKEKILLRLINNRYKTFDEIEQESEQAGISFVYNYWRVVYITASSDNKVNIISVLKHNFLDDYVIYSLEYPNSNSILAILGTDKDDPLLFKDKFKVIVTEIPKIKRVCIGGCFTNILDLSTSYQQVLMMNDTDKTNYDNGVAMFDDNSEQLIDYIYPKLSIDALYMAIINADIEKINLLTNILIDSAKAQKGNSIIMMSIYYDVLNIFQKAQSELRIVDYSAENTKYSYSQLCKTNDTSVIEKMIYDMSDKTIALISQEKDNPTVNPCVIQQRPVQKKQQVDISTIPSSPISDFIRENCLDDKMCVNFVAEHFGVSISNISHQFKAQTGMTISSFIVKAKFEYAKKLLMQGDIPLTEIANKMGYIQTSSFIRKFKSEFGYTPNEFKETLENNK